MGKGNFSNDFKRDAVAQITDICFLPCPNDALGAWQVGRRATVSKLAGTWELSSTTRYPITFYDL